MRAKRGFTLVEILIVVVILGILAAIVIPQFTEASTDAKTSRMAKDLQTVREQIQIYKVHHNDAVPAADADGGWTRMTSKTLEDGTVDAANGTLGPYLLKVPTNPYNGSTEITGNAPADGASEGWSLDADGNFWAAQDTDKDDIIQDDEK